MIMIMMQKDCHERPDRFCKRTNSFAALGGIKRKIRIKSIVFSLVLLVAISLSGGCAGTGGTNSDIDGGEEPFLFNSSAPHRFLNAEDYILLNADQPYFIDKKTGIIRPLILNPLERLLEKEQGGITTSGNSKVVHVSGNRAYILQNDYASMRLDAAAFDLSCVDLHTFDQSDLLSVGERVHERRFLPSPDLKETQDETGYFNDALQNGIGESPVMVARYFVLKNNLYTIENSKLCRRDLTGGLVSVLADDLYLRTQVSCDGVRIYYVNNKMELMEYTLKSSSLRKVTDDKVGGLYVSDDAVYYKNLANGQAVYRYDKQTGKVKKISDSDIPDMQAVASWLYYLDAEGRLCRMPSTGGESEVVINDAVGDYCVDAPGQSIYYETYKQIDGATSSVYYRVDGIDGTGGEGGKDSDALVSELKLPPAGTL